MTEVAGAGTASATAPTPTDLSATPALPKPTAPEPDVDLTTTHPVRRASPTLLELIVLALLVLAAFATIVLPPLGLGLGLLGLIAGIVLTRHGAGTRAVIAMVLALLSALAAIACAAILVFLTVTDIESTSGEVVQVDSKG